MRALALALASLLLAPVDAWANAVQTEAVRGKPSGEVRMGRPKSVVGARYRFEAQVGGYAAMPTGGPVTVTRASTESVVLSDGSTVATVPANALAIGPSGAQVYGPHVKRLVSNQRSSANTANLGICGAGSSWAVSGAAICAATPVEAPNGSLTAEEITVGANGVDDIAQTVGSLVPGTAFTFSLWVQRVDTTGTIAIRNPGNSTVGFWLINVALLGDGWSFVSKGHPALTVTSDFSVTASGTIGARIASNTGSPLKFRIWRPDQVEGSIVYPSAEVGALPLSVPGTAVSGANPLIGNNWCVRSDVTFPAAFNVSTPGLFQAGTALAANSYGVYASGGTIYFAVYDSSATVRYVSAGVAPLGQSKVVHACNVNGTLSVYYGGSLVSGVQSGAGTGLVSSHASLISVGSRGGQNLDGVFASVTLCNSGSPGDCR